MAIAQRKAGAKSRRQIRVLSLMVRKGLRLDMTPQEIEQWLAKI